MYDVDFGNLPNNAKIYESFVVCDDKLNRDFRGKNIMISISGGADSDIMIDLTNKIRKDKMHYVFFDTGIEYTATKKHLKMLESKYDIKIEIEKAKTPVPLGCKKYGLPFISKQVSDNIERLQRHGFKWENEDFETLYKRYPKCKSALKWWCNKKSASLSISHNKWLKEFLVENPPEFAISSKCCKGAKKDVAKQYHKEHEIELDIIGIRKAEGGARSSIPNCFTDNTSKSECSKYRPLFWYKDADKLEYENFFDINHSKCYTEYGMKRTGCAGCPFGRDFEKELQIIKEYEPQLYKAVNNIFGKSYEYMRKYKEFVKQKENE